MQINVTGRHLELSDDIKSHTTRRLRKLDRFYDGIIEARVNLSVERHLHQAEVDLSVHRSNLHAAQTADDLRTAVDRAVDKLERQLKRHKSKLRGHGHESVSPASATPIAPSFRDDEERVVRERVLGSAPYDLAPMRIEDAIMRMEQAGEDALVFTNETTARVNAVYRRQDGTMGLVDDVSAA